jgi:peroxiredoxin (alkyl hydroperoxide reductase subunit C)
MLDALIFHETHGDVCPADWNKGKDAMTPTAAGVADYLAKNAG